MKSSRLSGRTAWLCLVVAVPLSFAAMAMSEIDHAWDGGWWDVAWTSAAVAATVGTGAAANVALAANRRRWKLWTAASAFWLLGQIGWNVFGVTGFPTSPNAADLCWWAFAVLVIVSLIKSHADSRMVRLVTLVEVVPVAAAGISLSLAILWHDASRRRWPSRRSSPDWSIPPSTSQQRW